ncbi:unnamed protein product [Bathycoccus prasinos]
MPNFSNFSGCSTGYCTVSCNSCLTVSKPPTSSHETFGTSTTVSLNADGLVCAKAVLKWSLLMAIESKISASISSSSKSMTSIFSRMHCNAASVHNAAKSAPTKPCFFSASSKAFLKLDSDSPANLDMISGPLIKKKNAPVSFATALAIKVFPEPGGPYNKIPFGGFTPMVLNNCGCRNGNSTNSRICAICFLTPPTSS